ncbi:MAG: hypothetical protein PQJ58_22105 [Spirochaetales bacterium]|nr:hypothetical protein [Spirochaetales bacterium]
MKEIERQDWNYILYERDSRLYISVVYGSHVVGSINFFLNDDETAQYNKDRNFLEILSKDVRENIRNYLDRNIQDSPSDD